MLPPSPPRILVLDDDAGIRRMVEMVLESEGFEVLGASDGRVALGLVEQARFDLIVVDLQMPVMDGRTFYRELRQAGYQMPVIVLSAYGARVAAVELGAEAGMGKPFDIDDLIDLVNELLAPAGASRGASGGPSSDQA